MNFGTPVPLLIGIILILGALALFFLDKVKPGYARDSDKVYAVLLLISGLFLLAHLDMELLASFQQLLMGGMLTTLLIESIRSRDPMLRPNEPAMNRRPPAGPRYDERPPVRRGYRAELDDRPEFRGPQPPRMNPAQQPYRQDAYRNEQIRPPYEEFRGPAGRLQPSPPVAGPPQNGGMNGGMNGGRNAGGPPDNRYSDNARYGERPPAQRPPESYGNPAGRGPAGAPPIQEARVQPNERMPNDRPSGPPPNQRYPDAAPPRNREGNGERPARPNNADSGESSARTLNIRPRSEAPNIDDGVST